MVLTWFCFQTNTGFTEHHLKITRCLCFSDLSLIFFHLCGAVIVRSVDNIFNVFLDKNTVKLYCIPIVILLQSHCPALVNCSIHL